MREPCLKEDRLSDIDATRKAIAVVLFAVVDEHIDTFARGQREFGLIQLLIAHDDFIEVPGTTERDPATCTRRKPCVWIHAQ